MRFDGGMLQDIRYCLRTLAKHPGFTAVAVLTLAVGIGANAAIFSAINELFLRTVPAVREPGRLVALGRSSDGRFEGFGHLTYLKYREQAQSFTGLVASRGARLLWREGQETVILEGRLVSGNYFSLLGVHIASGRGFLPEEDQTPGTHPVAIVSHDVWKSRFGSNPALIDRSIHLNDTEFTVVGVAPEGFRGLEVGDAVDVWLPLMMEAQARPLFPQLNNDFFSTLGVVGRLKPGVSRQQAEAELTVLASWIEKPDGKTKKRRRVVLTPHIRLPDPGWRAEAASALALLSAVTALVLLIVCANLACLLLARSVSRRKEIAVRLALGAGRGRIIRQLLTESIVLATLGALAGLLVSHWIAALLRARIDLGLDFSIDRTVLLFTALLAALTAVVFGLAPALQATRGDLVADLKDQRTTTRRSSRLRNALVAGQVAVSLVLLTGAGLFVRTLQKASAVEVGFETKHLLLVAPDLDLAGYSDERAREFYRQLTERIAALPGVQVVSRANAVPRYGDMFWGGREIVLQGREAGASDARVQVEYNEIAPRYFETLGLGLVRGRGFTAQDDARAPGVAVVNESMARQLWPADDPLGKRLRFVQFMGMSAPFEIVGIVRDSRTLILDDRVRPEIYIPLEQGRRWNSTVLIRAANGSVGVTTAIRQELRQLDPTLPPVQVESMAERMAQGLSDQRMYAEWTSLFSVLALLLAAIGLYGTMAFAVSQRTHDIGIRMALGAQRGVVLSMVIREGLVVTAYGVAVGLLGSFALTRLLASHLYGVTPTDPVTFATSTLVLMAAALLACWVPASRATKVVPLSALRYE